MGTIFISRIYAPKKAEDWFLFKINESLVFSFRLGGIKKEIIENIDFSNYTEINAPDYVNVRLMKIYTDDFWVYMILENCNVISSGEVSIDSDGHTTIGLKFEKFSDFEADFFDDDFSEIMLNC